MKNFDEFEAYENLRYAVIEDGVQRYKTLLKRKWKYLNEGDIEKYRSRKLNDEIYELEDFFESGIIELWTEKLSGKYIRHSCYREAYGEFKAWINDQNIKVTKQYLKRLKRKAIAA